MKRKIVYVAKTGKYHVSVYVGKGQWFTNNQGHTDRNDADREMRRDGEAERAWKRDLATWDGKTAE